MRHSQDSKTKDTRHDESIFQSPRIALLKEEHWSYIQRHFHMSPRELQVAELVCKGFSNEEIAKDLKIKPGTVKTHLRNIYRRIHVRSKIAMLLKLVHTATKFSAKAGITLPIPIIDIKKPVKKPLAPAEVRKKEK